MQHLLSLTIPTKITPSQVFGFAAGTQFTTADGGCDIAKLHAGQRVHIRGDETAEVISVIDCGESEDWVSLPTANKGAPLIVAKDQLMVCRHFLCSALFGAREALYFAADLADCMAMSPSSETRHLYNLTLDREVRFLCVVTSSQGFLRPILGFGLKKSVGSARTRQLKVKAPTL